MSAQASDMSAWLLMGLPGLAYWSGFASAGWTAIGLAIGTYLNWLFVAKRLRVYSHRIDAFTIPDFFSRRFGDKSRVLTIISALFIVIFFIPYTASGFAACGKLFSSLFGIDYMLAIPKGDAHDWTDKRVEWTDAYGRTVRCVTFGFPITGVEALVPGPWHMKVRCQRIE